MRRKEEKSLQDESEDSNLNLLRICFAKRRGEKGEEEERARYISLILMINNSSCRISICEEKGRKKSARWEWRLESKSNLLRISFAKRRGEKGEEKAKHFVLMINNSLLLVVFLWGEKSLQDGERNKKTVEPSTKLNFLVTKLSLLYSKKLALQFLSRIDVNQNSKEKGIESSDFSLFLFSSVDFEIEIDTGW